MTGTFYITSANYLYSRTCRRVAYKIRKIIQTAATRIYDDSLIEEVCVYALIELLFVVFLCITNRPVHIENSRLYMPNKGEGGNEFRGKRIESIHNTNNSDERAYTLWCPSSERSADE